MEAGKEIIILISRLRIVCVPCQEKRIKNQKT